MKNGRSWARRRRTATREDPTDQLCGDHWDHVALDAEHRLVVSRGPRRANRKERGGVGQ